MGKLQVSAVAIIGACFLGLALVPVPGSFVHAQEPAIDKGVVTVVAPRIRERVRSGATEFMTVDKTVSVSFSDLDISRTADFYLLENRIRVVAKDICEELTEQFPRGKPRTAVCVERAVDDALQQARQIVMHRAGR